MKNNSMDGNTRNSVIIAAARPNATAFASAVCIRGARLWRFSSRASQSPLEQPPTESRAKKVLF